MVQDRAIVATADQCKIVFYDILIATIFNDLERPLTQISRVSHYLTLNISENANIVFYVITKN